jgi:excisionase family DNA binding protein
MAQALCTVDEAATQLKLHPKTVLRMIREGRLRAQRIGKSYRILRADLEALAGVPLNAESAIGEATVTCIVDVQDVGPELAQKWARQLPAALQAKPAGAAALRADIVYQPERAHLKVILVGAPAETADVLMLIRVWLAQLRA